MSPSALHKIEGLTGMSVVGVRGFGRSGTKEGGEHRIACEFAENLPHAKIEIVCRDDLVEPVVSAIQIAAHTGLRGDGKTYVTGVQSAIRIETNERGEAGV